jgi:formyltetrahydrofolate hydrolase
LIKLLNELVALDRSLERAKQDVIQRPDFNTFDAFRIFDVDGVGAITESEFKYALADIGVHVQAEDIELFFKRYNKRRNGRLDFGEFAAAFDPLDNYYANILCSRRSTERRLNIYQKEDLFASDTSHCFKELLLTLMRVEASAESLR